MSTSLLIVLSVAEAVLVIVVLGAGAHRHPPAARPIATGLGTLATALDTVESQHLRPLRPAVENINNAFARIIGLMPGVADKAAIVAAHARKQ